MLWYVLVRRSGKAEPEFKVSEECSTGLIVAETNGWHVVYGGFHTRHDADECFYALTHKSTLSVLSYC